ncbi:MAG: putative ABC exporter domain-containing protein, partial [Lachnospiraceae bacterium]|nr:putative ABC exporter domain-containing protein [Lachnospiraceae bacterium]
MRLFGYYAWHSFINQVKKLLHTWVLIFIVVCGLMGGLIGYMAASLSDTASESEQFYEDVTDIMDLEESMPAEAEPTEAPAQEAAEETEAESEEAMLPVSGGAILELAVGALVFIYLMYRALTADKNGSAIFQPADAILLFGSPMTPQAVLFFRLMTQLGAMLALTIYMGIQIPNLVLNVGMTLPAAVAALGAWLFSLFMGTVLSTLIYLLCDQYEFVRKNLHKILYGLVAVVAFGFLAFRRSTELPLWEAADAFFNSKISRFIPLWGWIKALPAYAN